MVGGTTLRLTLKAAVDKSYRNVCSLPFEKNGTVSTKVPETDVSHVTTELDADV
jgi:hypothetical protein